MKKLLLLTASLLLAGAQGLNAQRQMETLDRGLVAIKTAKGVFTSWRIPGDEYYGVTYNLYRDGTLIAGGLEVSNYTDTGGSASSTYTVAPVYADGTVGARCDAASVWADQYIEFRLKPVINPKTGRDVTRVMEITDVSAADLDGDGAYDFIIERQNLDFTIGNDSAYTRYEAYKIDGTKLWEVNLGPNMRDGNGSENACYAFDFDEDGRAEVVFRGADGTILPDGTVLGNETVNYRTGATGSQTYMENGDEWLVLLDGATGKTLDTQIFDARDGGYNTTTNNKTHPTGLYEPGTSAPGNNLARRSVAFWHEGNSKSDGGHRANKFHFGAPYLDGRHPSIYLGRGCYTNFHAATWDVVNKRLKLRWACAVDDPASEFYGQGYHNFTIADVDGDGRDEICHGNMVVDDNGRFLSSTGLGHGDAQHYGDLDPFRDGVEGFRCLEDRPGAVFVDAATNEVLFRWKRGTDNGRCLAGNFTNDFPGAELWTVDGRLWSASTSRTPEDVVATSAPGVTMNARIYWDGDVLDESFDYASRDGYQGIEGAVYKYGSTAPIFTTSGCITINSTKGNPCIQADLFGDWREEFMLPTADNRSVRIYTTVAETKYRIYSLMYDAQYRQAIYWQPSGYNQPPHVSFFLGNLEGYLLPPPPACTNGKVLLSDALTAETDGRFAMACETSPTTLTASAPVSPSYLQVNSPADYVITGGGLTGQTVLLKQGQGDLTITDGTYTQTGATELWYGSLTLDVAYTTSPIVMKRFAQLNSGSEVGNVSMEYGAVVRPAGKGTVGTLKARNVDMLGGAIIEFDILNDGTAYDQLVVDSLTIGTANCIGATPTFYIHRTASGTLAPGEYTLVKANKGIKGQLADITVDGLKGLSASIKAAGNSLVLVVEAMRVPTTVTYDGSGDWDLNKSESFLIDDQHVSFVTGDAVTVNASTANVTLSVTEDVEPSTLTIIGNKNVTITGPGKIGGTAKIIKRGLGTLYIKNVNDFTGGVDVQEGTLSIASYADAQNNGALGAYQGGKARLNIETGARLVATATGILDASVTIGDSTIIQTDAALTIQGALRGTRLIKTGTSSLSWTVDPVLKKAEIKGGTWNVGYCSGKSAMADTMVIHQGTLAFTSGSLYQTCTNVWVVPEGANITISPSNAVAYQNRLYGAGTINWTWHNSTTPREYLEGDWSAFEGQINFTGQSTDHPIRLCNSYGLPKATVRLMSNNTLLTIGGDPDTKRTHGAVTANFRIGHLIVAGTSGLGEGYTASNTFYIGGLGKNIAGGSMTINAPMVKEGTGMLTLGSGTKTSGVTGSGAITIQEGSLRVNGGYYTSATDKRSASGTGALTLKAGTTMYAQGYVGNTALKVEDGAIFSPGFYYVNSSSLGLTVQASLNLQPGGVIQYRLSKNNVCNTFAGRGNLQLDGTLQIIQNSDYTPAAGDEYVLWNSVAFRAANNPTVEIFDLPDSLAWDMTELLTKTGTLRVIVNPASGIGQVAQPDDVAVTVTIFRLDGQALTTFTSTANAAFTEAAQADIPIGAYIVRVDGPAAAVTKKMIKR